MNELLAGGLWPRLRKIGKSARRKSAAVAYVTDDRFIKFGKGDVLITDASDGAIKAGQTSAQVLKRAFSHGAVLFSVTGLHAKVYLFDRVAVIGSANLSSSSEQLMEAALLTDQPSSVSMAHSLIEDLKKAGELVDRAFVNRICKLSVTKTPYRASTKKRLTTRNGSARTWLVGLKVLKNSDEEDAASEEGRIEAERNLSKENSDVSTIQFRGKSAFRKEAKLGDNIIQIWTPPNSKKPSVVFHHSPIVRRQDSAKHNCTWLYVEEFADAEETTLTWKKFQRLFAQLGIPGKLSQWTHREIAPHHAEGLHSLWFDQ